MIASKISKARKPTNIKNQKGNEIAPNFID